MKEIEKRKADHIHVSLEGGVASSHDYWDDVKLVHNALPEVDLEEIDTSVEVLGKVLSAPLMVTAITGGYSKAEKINRNLAEACAELGIGMGIGSQRAALEKGDPSSYSVLRDYDVPLKIGNIGAPQLIPQRDKRAFGAEDARKALDMIGGDVLAVHLNFLQEAAQPEGDTRARGCHEAIRSLAREVPLIVKETGAGISREVALRLKGIGVRGLDISGTGGTSFSKVEALRSHAQGDRKCAAIGRTFGEWGIPAPISVRWASVGLPIIASGGIADGHQAAKSIVVGAQCAGTARAVLKEAIVSSQEVEGKLRLMLDEFRTAMFLTGSSSIAELASRDFILTGPTREWAAGIKEDRSWMF